MSSKLINNKSSKNNIFIAKSGLVKGLNTVLLLSKIIIPVYFFITFLEYTNVLSWISMNFSPIMSLFGLPGDAALALVFGNFVNLFAALAVISQLTLTTKQITILAIMLSFSHSLFMETAIAKKTGLNVIIVLSIRLSLAFISGIILNIIM